MIEVKRLEVNYKRQEEQTKALGPIDLTIESGEIIALIGPSGCGKSTLLNVLGGIITDYEGQVIREGEKIDYKKQAIGYIPQGYGLLPWKTVFKNCLLPHKIKGTKLTDEMSSNIEEVLEELGIKELKDRYPIALSGGQRQRVAIARAFAFQPDLLLMDEPFSALDAIMKEEAVEIFLKVWKKHQCTSVIVTHSIEEALYLGKKIVILSNTPGRIIDMIENPYFGQKDKKEDKAFLSLYSTIKQHIREGVEG